MPGGQAGQCVAGVCSALVCGDGRIDPPEQCRLNGHACVPICGDGLIVGSEECDVGNLGGQDVRDRERLGWTGTHSCGAPDAPNPGGRCRLITDSCAPPDSGEDM